ncbi:MAG: hypothetical protein AB8B69_15885 [Chitinophagales bacterium]
MYSKTLYYTLLMGTFLFVHNSSFAQQNATFKHLPRMLYCGTTPETNIGTSDGIIHFEVENGDTACGNYTYAWSSTNGFETTTIDKPTGNTIRNLTSGLYRVTVTDCVGTTVMDSVYINRIIDHSNSRKEGNKTGRDLNKKSLLEHLSPFLLRKPQPNSTL